nr:MAG: hypothetical protein DiTV3a_F3ORF1 [Diabrotica toursvirus 3a]
MLLYIKTMTDIKNPEFILCLNFVTKSSNINLYRFIEKILYGDITSSEEKNYKREIILMGPLNFCKKYQEIYFTREETLPLISVRKNVKDIMLENYVIRTNKTLEYLKMLKLKIMLKTISSKNIIIDKGHIVDIKI